MAGRENANVSWRYGSRLRLRGASIAMRCLAQMFLEHTTPIPLRVDEIRIRPASAAVINQRDPPLIDANDVFLFGTGKVFESDSVRGGNVHQL